MPDLCEQLRRIFQGRVCLVGVGNPDAGDDGAGMRLAETLAEGESRNPRSEIRDPKSETRDPGPEILLAGLEPERHLSRLGEGGFDDVAFLDAVDCGAEPGAVVLLNASEMANRFPQVSTHRLSLGLLARLIEAQGGPRAWLLGIQPGTLRGGARLSPAVQMSVEALAEVVRGLIAPLPAPASRGGARLPSSPDPTERGHSCPLSDRGHRGEQAERNVRAPIGFTPPEPC